MRRDVFVYRIRTPVCGIERGEARRSESQVQYVFLDLPHPHRRFAEDARGCRDTTNRFFSFQYLLMAALVIVARVHVMSHRVVLSQK